MPIHIHQSCCVARALHDDPQDRCFERPEHFSTYKKVLQLERVQGPYDKYEMYEEEPGSAINRSSEVAHALGEAKDMADCLWDTLKRYKDPEDLPPPIADCCNAALGPRWKERYGKLCSAAEFNTTSVFESIRVPGHQLEIEAQGEDSPTYWIESSSDPRIAGSEFDTVDKILACGDAGICKSM